MSVMYIRTCRNPHIDVAHKKLHWTTVEFVYDVRMWLTIRWIAYVNENVGFALVSVSFEFSLDLDFSMLLKSQSFILILSLLKLLLLNAVDIFFIWFSSKLPFVFGMLISQVALTISFVFLFVFIFTFAIAFVFE